MYTPIVFFDDDDEFMKSERGKKRRRKLRKLRNKLERMNIKMTKRLVSLFCPIKRTHWNGGKRVRGMKHKKI